MSYLSDGQTGRVAYLLGRLDGLAHAARELAETPEDVTDVLAGLAREAGNCGEELRAILLPRAVPAGTGDRE